MVLELENEGRGPSQRGEGLEKDVEAARRHFGSGHPQALGDKKPGTELRACQESGLNLEDDEAIARFL